MAVPEYWWASFATGDEFLGVVITARENAEDIVALSRRLWMLGLNPGGEMMAQYTTGSEWAREDDWALDLKNQDRLIGRAELAAKGYVKAGDVNPKGFRREEFEANLEANTVDNEEPT